MDRFVLGRALDVCSWSRLRERLRACTPRGTRRMTKNNRAGTRGLLCLVFDATLFEMERLVHQRELVCITALHQHGGANTRSVEVANMGAIARALAMSPSVLAAAEGRHYEGKNGRVLTRVLLELRLEKDSRMFLLCLGGIGRGARCWCKCVPQRSRTAARCASCPRWRRICDRAPWFEPCRKHIMGVDKEKSGLQRR